jgi:hypothetical protein
MKLAHYCVQWWALVEPLRSDKRVAARLVDLYVYWMNFFLQIL